MATLSRHAGIPRTLQKWEVMDIIQKWGITYNGISEPFAFIESLEEMTDMYELSTEHLPGAMPLLLIGRALIWYRNMSRRSQTWEEFKRELKAFFLSFLYLEKLEDDIHARRQRSHESYKDYVVEMLNMMRHTNMSTDEKLNSIFRNSLPEYWVYIKRGDFDNLKKLLELAGEYENISRQRVRQMTSTSITAVVSNTSEESIVHRSNTCIGSIRNGYTRIHEMSNATNGCITSMVSTADECNPETELTPEVHNGSPQRHERICNSTKGSAVDRSSTAHEVHNNNIRDNEINMGANTIYTSSNL